MDKMGFYEQAEQDSIKIKEQRRNDPYYQAAVDTSAVSSSLVMEENKHEKQVYEKLEQIDKELTKGSASLSPSIKPTPSFVQSSGNHNSTDVDRLEEIIKNVPREKQRNRS